MSKILLVNSHGEALALKAALSALMAESDLRMVQVIEAKPEPPVLDSGALAKLTVPQLRHWDKPNSSGFRHGWLKDG